MSSVQDANYGYATRKGTKIRACEQLQKSCKHEQASTHLIFVSNSSRGKILRALSNGAFDTPDTPDCGETKIFAYCSFCFSLHEDIV